MGPRSQIWEKVRLETEKQLIHDQIDATIKNEDLEGRLKYILSKIAELEYDGSELSQLRGYIYIVSALAHHARFGGLNSKQVDRLAKLAKAILRVNGVIPSKSELSTLYVDLYSVLSHSYRRNGLPFKAAWDQRVCAQFLPKGLTKATAFQALSNGIFALRLGHAALALEEFDRAEKIGLLSTHLGRVRIEKLRAMRLLLQFSEADTLTDVTLQTLSLSPSEKMEILWEQMCRQAQKTKDISNLITMVRGGKQFNESIYVQEAFLWTRIVDNRRWLEQFKTHKMLGRYANIKVQPTGYFRDCVKVIERCYDYSFPLMFRLDEASTIVQNTNRLVSIDKALLVLLSVIRWLTRSKAHSLARLVWEQYRGISYQVTEGQSPDVLGFAPECFLKNPEKTDREAA